MLIKGLQDEVFGDYKKPAMQIAFPYCTFKCDKENGCNLCQNSELAQEPTLNVSSTEIIKRYLDNPITKAVVLGGLEPFDSEMQLLDFVDEFRFYTDDDIVIYTGYTEEEFGADKWKTITHTLLTDYPNIIIKYGRFRPNQEPHYDKVLGVKLASDNQYAKRIS